MQAVANECKPLDDQVTAAMENSIRAVCGDLRLVLILVLCTIIRWLDWQIAHKYFRGFNSIGHVAMSNLDRAVPLTAVCEEADMLGPDADDWNLECVRCRAPTDADLVIWED